MRTQIQYSPMFSCVTIVIIGCQTFLSLLLPPPPLRPSLSSLEPPRDDDEGIDPVSSYCCGMWAYVC
jgi:hypothetical protein